MEKKKKGLFGRITEREKRNELRGGDKEAREKRGKRKGRTEGTHE